MTRSYGEGFGETWHCTVKREDKDYRSYRSFGADDYGQLAEVSDWISQQAGYAAQAEPMKEIPGRAECEAYIADKPAKPEQ